MLNKKLKVFGNPVTKIIDAHIASVLVNQVSKTLGLISEPSQENQSACYSL